MYTAAQRKPPVLKTQELKLIVHILLTHQQYTRKLNYCYRSARSTAA